MSADYHASIEWICEHVGVIRLHEQEGDFGDPYVWACTVENDFDHGAILKGVCAPMPQEGARAVAHALWKDGFNRYRYDRRQNGKIRHVVKEIKI